jgi:hypothetical protein
MRIFTGGLVLFNLWLLRDREPVPLAVKLIAVVFKLGFVFAVMVGAILLMAFLTAFLTSDHSIVGAMSVALTDDGFTAESPVGKTSFKWTGLHSILVADGFIYVRISDTKFLSIPERAFTAPAISAAFAATLRERMAAAKRRSAT